MRVVLATNLLVSALIFPSGPTDRLYVAWKEQRYALVTSREQIEEFRRITRYPRVKKLIDASAAGTMYNQLSALSTVLADLPTVDRSADPGDNFLLAMVEAGEADYLVSGDRAGVLVLGQHGRTQILTARSMLKILGIE